VAKIAAGGGALGGRLVDRRGRARRAAFSRYDVFISLVAGDFQAELRRQFPTAVRSALRGDADPMLRLVRHAGEQGGAVTPRELSDALFTATTCEEAKLPWPRTEPFATRGARTRAAVGLLAPSSLTPFDRDTVLRSDVLNLCSRWPAAAAAPVPGPGPLPDVSTLIVEGRDDLRTPIEAARAVAAKLPRATLVTVNDAGHSPLDSAGGACVEGLVPSFFSGARLPRSCNADRPRRPAGPVPDSFAQVGGRGGVPGRAARAVRLTINDLVDDLAFAAPDPADSTAGRGLRAGRYSLRDIDTVTLRGLSFVRGIRVTGRITRVGSEGQRGRLQVSGPRGARGVLTVRGARLSGRLGGRVHAEHLTATVARSRATASAARQPSPFR